MFGIDSSELMLIAIVALVVVGPKELPGLLRTWGKWMAQMRGMASEFRGHVDEMIRQSELDQVKKQLTDASTGIDLQALDPTREIRGALQDGMAEGEKAMAEARTAVDGAPAPPVDNPLAEPDSAPQVALETQPETRPETLSETTLETPVEPPPPAPETPAEAVSPAESAPEPPPHAISQDDKPKAAVAG